MAIDESSLVYLGLGSNLGDRVQNIRQAIDLLSQKAKMVRYSHLYDTAPVGNNDQPRFLNMACKMITGRTPFEFLSVAKEIEEKMGRLPGPLNSPRPIDVDILFFGDRIIDTPNLIIPHPRLQERAFVLVPLAEIAPDLKHPVIGKTIKKILDELIFTTKDIKRFEMGNKEANMYEISVELDFDAAHFLRGYQGKCESLHGHRFKVVATVQTHNLNDIGLGYDFTELKRNLGDVLARYDHTCLNEITPFKRINPSSENIATTIFRELKKKMKDASAIITAIEVWESPGSHVVYRPG